MSLVPRGAERAPRLLFRAGSFMGILQRYILRSFLVAAGLTGLVLTFVLSVGFLFQVFQFVMRGAPAGLVVQYLAASLPEVLGFTIPLALMVASLLVFSRMSTDSEVAAMKACGVSFLAIMRGPLLVGVLCTAAGFFLQNYAMPRGHYVRRTLANRLALDAGVQLIEPGRFIDEIDNVTIFCDRKVEHPAAQGKASTTLYNLIAIDRRDGFLREIQADRAEMQAQGSDLVFTLHQATVSPPDKGISGIASFDSFTYTCKDVISRSRKYLKKPKDFDFRELLQAEREAAVLKGTSAGAAKWHSKLKFLLNYRMVWALSSLCFVLVGIPLGCQTQRRDSAKGMMLGVGVGIAFFLFVLLSEALADKPMAFPWLLVWIPVLFAFGTACYLIPKHQ